MADVRLLRTNGFASFGTFSSEYPSQLNGRISPEQFQAEVEAINNLWKKHNRRARLVFLTMILVFPLGLILAIIGAAITSSNNYYYGNYWLVVLGWVLMAIGLPCTCFAYYAIESMFLKATAGMQTHLAEVSSRHSPITWRLVAISRDRLVYTGRYYYRHIRQPQIELKIVIEGPGIVAPPMGFPPMGYPPSHGLPDGSYTVHVGQPAPPYAPMSGQKLFCAQCGVARHMNPPATYCHNCGAAY
eukprot:jgi/Chlat1/3237/Chrsp22S03509